MLAEAGRELGGRVSRESRLPGLSEWARVRNYRVHQIDAMANVEVFRESSMTAEDILDTEADHVVIATGAHWRADGVGLYTDVPLSEYGPGEQIFTPDDIMAGRMPSGPTLVYDDDHYYMASVIAEKLRGEGIPVIFVTPESIVSSWGVMTSEQYQVQRRLMEVGVKTVTGHTMQSYDGSEARIHCVYGGGEQDMAVDAVVSVTSRVPDDTLYHELVELVEKQPERSPKSIRRIGDCEAPSIIASAVFSGHRYARELDTEVNPDNRMRYDRVFYEEER
jgi:dimethylamine/trimethylamine dehydrogenase